MRNFLFAFSILCIFSSCKKEEKTQTYSNNETVDSSATAEKKDSVTNISPVQSQQTTQVLPQNLQPTQNQPQVVQQVAPGMNPQHGQPGHRCDIPVGAPLNSPPGNSQQQANTMVPNIATPKPENTPVQITPIVTDGNSPATNPPHGQPGHRCDIAVGAPLK